MESFPSIVLTSVSGIWSIALWLSQPILDLFSTFADIARSDRGMRRAWAEAPRSRTRGMIMLGRGREFKSSLFQDRMIST